MGGAALADSFRHAGLIDRYIISIIPTLLGEGIPLFASGSPTESLTQGDCRTFDSGVVQLTYTPRT